MENDLSMGAAWMNGKVLPISQAMIPVNDWGLVHSDITYDVVPVIDGAFFRFDEYLARFLSSMENLNLDPGMSKRDIKAALHQMVGKSSLRDSYVAMVCSRGKPKIAGSRDPRDCENHFFAWCVPYVHIIKPEVVEKGATAWIAQNAYRIPENSVNPRVKNYHWLDLVNGMFEAYDRGHYTAVLVDEENNVLEGPGFNIFSLDENGLKTPKIGVLEGITRQTAIRLASELDIPVQEKSIGSEEFINSDEAFATSTAGGIIPITKINGKKINNGKIGKVTSLLKNLYWEKHTDPQWSQSVDELI